MISMDIVSLECSQNYYERLAEAKTHAELAEQYKNKVFWDDKELLVWNNQPRKHRFEYFVAIELFKRYKYLSLVEKYGGHGKETHSMKRDMVQRVAGVEIRKILDKTGGKNAQCPDLFVFTEDMRDWCFVEVKGPKDSLRPEQKKAFDSLSMLTGKPCHLMTVKLVSE